MLASVLKSGDLDSLALSRIEQKSLYAAGVFFVLAMVFSALSIASTILSTVSLSGPVEKAIAAGAGVATALVAALLGYWIFTKATSTRDKRSRLVPAARPLLPGGILSVAVFLAGIATMASGPLEDTYLSALAGATLFIAGLFGCLFGARFRARAARQAQLLARRDSSIATVVNIGNPV